MQCPAHIGEAALPSRCRHRGACVDAAHRLHVQFGRAQFNSGCAIGGALCHQQILIGNPRAHQAIRFDHVESPALAHSAADRVHGSESIMAEVEPQLARERQLIVIARGQSATALDDLELGIARDAITREPAPIIGNIGLAGIDGLGPLDRCYTQAIDTLKAPDLISRPWSFACGAPQRFGNARTVRAEPNLPVSGSHLHAQPTIRLEPRRKPAAQADRNKPSRQNRRQQFFTRLAGCLYANHGGQQRRNVIAQQPIDLQLELLLLDGAAALAEPHACFRSARVERSADRRASAR